ncbi:MAG: Permease [Naasia sp.]|uniref:sulfite exporter TauE/SafE family protein n=1 Tax=Naasia sp. TaxID=2546198 RepID=UPI002635207E|nr:sulfite exporter TauE/SafE family protein [Naasia sp.]MCU1570098.1 Permease [Naasia sp.]
MTDAAAPAERRGARQWLVLALIGAIGGTLSGAFGVGGGIVMVPLLVSLAGMDQRRAAATSLVAIVPTSITASLTYLASGHMDVVVGLLVAVGGVAGSYLGARLLRRIPLGALRWMFIALLVLIALRMALVAPERGTGGVELNGWVALGLVALGLFMGVASGLFGIGGGVIAVPFLIAAFGLGELVAKGTSLLVMIPTALMGTATNLRGGLVSVRAGLVVGLAATVFSFPGVALAFLLPPQVSGLLFAALLLAAAIQLTVRTLRARRG